MLAVLLKSLYLVIVSMSTDLIILYHCLHCGGTFLLHFTCNMVGCCYNYIRIINSLHIYMFRFSSIPYSCTKFLFLCDNVAIYWNCLRPCGMNEVFSELN